MLRFMKVSLLGLIVGLATAVPQGHNGAANATLPEVNLGYVVQRATFYNASGDYYSFANVRYSQPPLGDRRWAPPLPPAKLSSPPTDDGSTDRICYQSDPRWTLTAIPFLKGKIDVSGSDPTNTNSTDRVTPADPRETEDCLFLDVTVPKKIYDNRNGNKLAPVLVWIHGGGYSSGYKTSAGSPAGLLAASQVDSKDGIIIVTINYRLGLFGWLGGPTFRESGGTPNLGLLDQRLALEWVQDNINIFGGNKHRVTVMGESAGGGSVLHQITAYGGLKGGVPFQQAIPQSAAYYPNPGNALPEDLYQSFLSRAQVGSLQAARQLSSSAVQQANIVITADVKIYGHEAFGPLVDGNFVTALPVESFDRGQFDKTTKIMIGHNANEGLLFSNPFFKTSADFSAFFTSVFPLALAQTITYITETLYPPDYSGAQPYKTLLERTAFAIAESTITCNSYLVSRAFNYETYSYRFDVPPAFHSLDIGYTFFNGESQELTATVSAFAAKALQRYITSFMMTGVPKADGLSVFEEYGSASNLLDIGATAITKVVDPNNNDRCRWWGKALFY
ncbi:MAG: hypothetical protein M1829_000021 [Trizodia sp. TS-e1964]|nr:MAG: hypothetical protein M1829_000021 [Trizodia sp. TS-e1964]